MTTQVPPGTIQIVITMRDTPQARMRAEEMQKSVDAIARAARLEGFSVGQTFGPRIKPFPNGREGESALASLQLGPASLPSAIP